MIRREDVFKIGRLGKTHGVKGEVSFLFDDDVFDRTESDFLILELEGILVPFYMEEYRFRSDTTALVKFEGVDTQERARELTGTDVYFPCEAVPEEDDLLTWTALVGFQLCDAQSGKVIGTIASVDDSTINVLFELSDGHLIPASEELITHIDTKKQEIEINLPEGILEL